MSNESTKSPSVVRKETGLTAQQQYELYGHRGPYSMQEVAKACRAKELAALEGIPVREAIKRVQQEETRSHHDPQVLNGVVGEAGDRASQSQLARIQDLVAEAETDIAWQIAAKNFALTRLEMTGGDFSHRPDLMQVVELSEKGLQSAKKGKVPMSVPLGLEAMVAYAFRGDEFTGIVPTLSAATNAVTPSLPASAN